MMQDTSLMAFDGVRPVAESKRKIVYATLATMGPSTNAEIAQKLVWTINCVTPRIFELRKEGWVIDDGQRECTVTKHTAHVWRAR